MNIGGVQLADKVSINEGPSSSADDFKATTYLLHYGKPNAQGDLGAIKIEYDELVKIRIDNLFPIFPL